MVTCPNSKVKLYTDVHLHFKLLKQVPSPRRVYIEADLFTFKAFWYNDTILMTLL